MRRHLTLPPGAKLALVTFALAVTPAFTSAPPARLPRAEDAPRKPGPATRRLATVGRACTFGDWLGR